MSNGFFGWSDKREPLFFHFFNGMKDEKALR